KGTRTGVATDINGKFRLQARKGDIIIVSGAGLETREMTIDNEKELSIYLNRLTMGDAGIVVVAGHVSVKRPRKEKKPIPLITQLFKDTASKFFKVYPNPVPAGSNISIEWKQTEEGYYTLQLFNQAGQPVHQQEIWIDAEARLLNIDIPVIAAGSYFLVMMNKKSGKKYSEKIIVQ
ncbi:MAG TPA: T9SS type A sorting domain-containing protein, partial [Chitinophagaceae bacterium]|nr:T9SS type A sorting domain-containing protein [Chitinophagaceae bacterium]